VKIVIFENTLFIQDCYTNTTSFLIWCPEFLAKYTGKTSCQCSIVFMKSNILVLQDIDEC